MELRGGLKWFNDNFEEKRAKEKAWTKHITNMDPRRPLCERTLKENWNFKEFKVEI